MKRWQVYIKKSIISMLSDFCEIQGERNFSEVIVH
jgi:hypothetical protein